MGIKFEEKRNVTLTVTLNDEKLRDLVRSHWEQRGKEHLAQRGLVAVTEETYVEFDVSSMGYLRGAEVTFIAEVEDAPPGIVDEEKLAAEALAACLEYFNDLDASDVRDYVLERRLWEIGKKLAERNKRAGS